jgi:hypothetical protein
MFIGGQSLLRSAFRAAPPLWRGAEVVAAVEAEAEATTLGTTAMREKEPVCGRDGEENGGKPDGEADGDPGGAVEASKQRRNVLLNP